MMTDDVTQNIIDEISKADLPNESSYISLILILKQDFN